MTIRDLREDDLEFLGEMLYRLFTEAEHGDGFVDEHTPEYEPSDGKGRMILDLRGHTPRVRPQRS